MNITQDNKYKLHILITIAIMAFIFIQSALSGDLSGAQSGIIVSMLHKLTGVDCDVLSLIVRKTAHFTEYMILGISLAVNAFDWSRIKKVKWSALSLWSIAWAIGTVYAVTDEMHQYFVPGRECAVMDMMIDSTGVAVGAIITMLIGLRMRIRIPHIMS